MQNGIYDAWIRLEKPGREEDFYGFVQDLIFCHRKTRNFNVQEDVEVLNALPEYLILFVIKLYVTTPKAFPKFNFITQIEIGEDLCARKEFVTQKTEEIVNVKLIYIFHELMALKFCKVYMHVVARILAPRVLNGKEKDFVNSLQAAERSVIGWYIARFIESKQRKIPLSENRVTMDVEKVLKLGVLSADVYRALKSLEIKHRVQVKRGVGIVLATTTDGFW